MVIRKRSGRKNRAFTFIAIGLLCANGAASAAAGQLQGRIERVEPSLRGLTQLQQEAVARLTISGYIGGMLDAAQEVTLENEFEGWDGETLVELTDGTVLKQAEYSYAYCYAYRPDATLMCGPWQCKLVVHDSSCSESVAVTVVSTGRNVRLRRIRRLQQAAIGLDVRQVLAAINTLFGE